MREDLMLDENVAEPCDAEQAEAEPLGAESLGPVPGSRRGRSGRRKIPGVRRLIVVACAFLVVVGLFALAYWTPLMSVRAVAVVGNTTVSDTDIRTAAAIPAGEPLLQVDTMVAARRVAAIARIAQVRVTRSFPSTIDIAVTERIPVASLDHGRHLIDGTGFVFDPVRGAKLPPLPDLTTPHPGPADPATRAATSVLTVLPGYVRRDLLSVAAVSPVDVRLTLSGNRTVRWGDAEKTAEKADVLRYVLAQDGTVYDVSSPQNPAVR